MFWLEINSLNIYQNHNKSATIIQKLKTNDNQKRLKIYVAMFENFEKTFFARRMKSQAI